MSRAVDRRLLAVFVALHGLAHFAGTSDLLARAADGRAADLLIGTTSNPLTLRVLAVAWAATAVAYLAVAVPIWAGRAGWPQWLGWVTLVSLGLSIVALWASVIGVAIDVALLVGVLALRARARRSPA
jgi:hypothetical protein